MPSDSEYIITPQTKIPAGAVNHTQGVLNLRTARGAVTRRIMMPVQTARKARSVPMETRSASTSNGNSAASSAATAPMMMVPRCGVWKRLWTVEKAGGRKPSRAIE